MISPLDVIWIFDRDIDPANWKMAVCICPEDGLFYRINSYDEYPIGVLLPKEPDHPFLKWDSYLQCGKYPIVLDEFQVQEALRRNGGKPIGSVAPKHSAEIFAAIMRQPTISREVKALIKIALNC